MIVLTHYYRSKDQETPDINSATTPLLNETKTPTKSYDSDKSTPLLTDSKTNDENQSKKAKSIKASISDIKRSIDFTVKRSVCHWFYIILMLSTVFIALCMGISQILPLFRTEVHGLELAVRCYMTLFSLVIVAVELELVFHQSTLFNNWIAKGIIYSFLGLVGMEEARTVSEDIHLKHPDSQSIYFTLLFISASSWVFVAVGMLYFLLGIFCMKGVRDRIRENYKQKVDETRKQKQKLNDAVMDVKWEQEDHDTSET